MALDTGLISKHFLRRTARWRERSLEATYPGSQYTVRKYHGRLFKWSVWRVSDQRKGPDPREWQNHQ